MRLRSYPAPDEVSNSNAIARLSRCWQLVFPRRRMCQMPSGYPERQPVLVIAAFGFQRHATLTGKMLAPPWRPFAHIPNYSIPMHQMGTLTTDE